MPPLTGLSFFGPVFYNDAAPAALAGGRNEIHWSPSTILISASVTP
jgi:hypothetical protein